MTDAELMQAFEIAFNNYMTREFKSTLMDARTLQEIQIKTNLFVENFTKSLGKRIPPIKVEIDGGTLKLFFEEIAMLTIERVREIFNEVKEGHIDWNGDNAIQGLLLIGKYIDYKTTDILTSASHDKIDSVSVEDAISAGMTEQDFRELAGLNWMIEGDYLSCFV